MQQYDKYPTWLIDGDCGLKTVTMVKSMNFEDATLFSIFLTTNNLLMNLSIWNWVVDFKCDHSRCQDECEKTFF